MNKKKNSQWEKRCPITSLCYSNSEYKSINNTVQRHSQLLNDGVRIIATEQWEWADFYFLVHVVYYLMLACYVMYYMRGEVELLIQHKAECSIT